MLLYAGLIAHISICAFTLMQFWASRAAGDCGKILRSILFSCFPQHMSVILPSLLEAGQIEQSLAQEAYLWDGGRFWLLDFLV